MVLIYGVGVKNGGLFPTKEGKKLSPVYRKWVDMLTRCYCLSYQELRPSYKSCKIEGDFLHFQKFEKWYSEQLVLDGIKYELDKDILFKGNRVYSEKTCALVPKEINQAFKKSDASRGNLPVGVWRDKRRGGFVSGCRMGGKQSIFPPSATVEQAFNKYKVAKESYIKDLAEKYKDAISRECYNALYNYEVCITD